VITLGLWDGHDAGAALLVDGQLVAAVNEERLTRRKLEIRFPRRALACCLEIANLRAVDVDTVAVATSDAAKTLERWLPAAKERYYAVRRRKARPGRAAAWTRRLKYRVTEWGSTPISRALSRLAIERELRQVGLLARDLRLVDHHECHALAAASGSGMSHCAVLTIDGLGDGLSSTISVFRDGALRRVAVSPARHSVGVFFEHVTSLLNMRELEDEGKVMALADFAARIPDHDNPMLELVKVLDGVVCTPVPGHALRGKLEDIQWCYPNEQFAYMAQRTVERTCEQLSADAVRLTGVRKLAVGGGVASNVRANRRVRLLRDVEDVYVFPHMGDGGLALGAALAALSVEERSRFRLDRLDLGPEYSENAMETALRQANVPFERAVNLEEQTASLIADGEIIVWFQGRMEYGPRALGHRSVLARADRIDLRDRLNLSLKQRVWYQPFCPTLLESDAVEVLSDWTGPTNRAMTMAYLVKPEFRSRLSGVTALDGSCRPQIVPDDDAGRFAELLRCVRRCTGLAAVLNTSLNIHGEPLVCTPLEAVDTFLRSGADALAIGPFLATRRTGHSA